MRPGEFTLRVTPTSKKSRVDNLLQALLSGPKLVSELVWIGGYLPDHIRYLRNQIEGTHWHLDSRLVHVPTRYGDARQMLYTLWRDK